MRQRLELRLQTIHPFLRELMERHDCETPSELADKLRIPRKTLTAWAKKRPQHIDEIVRMCTVFGVPPSAWVAGWSIPYEQKSEGQETFAPAPRLG